MPYEEIIGDQAYDHVCTLPKLGAMTLERRALIDAGIPHLISERRGVVRVLVATPYREAALKAIRAAHDARKG